SSSFAKRLEGAMRESSRMRVAQLVAPGTEMADASAPVSASVRTRSGRIIDDLPFARLIEMIVTGALGADDEVDLLHTGFRKLREIESLARHLPPSTGTTAHLRGPGTPDYAAVLPETPMIEVLGWMLARRETGALFVEQDPAGGTEGGEREERTRRKELYF